MEEVIQVAIGGRAFSEMVEGEKRYDIVLRLPKDLRDDPDDIARIPVDIKGGEGKPGARIPLSHLAKIVAAQGGSVLHLPGEQPTLHPHQVQRQGTGPGLRHRGGPAKVEDPQTGAKIPEGYRIEWSGRVRPDAGGERTAHGDGAALGRPDHGPALHHVQLA